MQQPVPIPTLRTNRLTLEPLSMAHSTGMYELWSSKEVCEYSGIVTDYDQNIIQMPASSQDKSDLIIDFWLKAQKDGWGFRWAIILSDTNDFVGSIGFNSLKECSEIAFHLVPTYWGKGIMLEAANKAIDWRLDNSATEIEAFIEPNNKASIKLTTRLGLKPTGEISDGAERYLSKRN